MKNNLSYSTFKMHGYRRVTNAELEKAAMWSYLDSQKEGNRIHLKRWNLDFEATVKTADKI